MVRPTRQVVKTSLDIIIVYTEFPPRSPPPSSCFRDINFRCFFYSLIVPKTRSGPTFRRIRGVVKKKKKRKNSKFTIEIVRSAGRRRRRRRRGENVFRSRDILITRC